MSNPLIFPVGDLANNFSPNPMVRLHGRGPEGVRCKTCKYITPTSYRTNRTYWKCGFRKMSHCSASDHRLKWDACRLYERESV